MNTTVNQKIEDALLEFYLEADKDTINEILQEDINDIEAYKKKRNKLLFMINAKAKKQAKKVIKKINKLISYTSKKGYEEFEDLITDLKEKADVITLSNSENGASYYLDSLLK